MDILRGRQIGNINLATVLQSGAFSGMSLASDAVTSISEHFMTYWSAIAINHIWLQQYTYIVEVDNVFGCENDSKGPSWLKVCLDGDEYANKVYYLYSITDKDQNGDESLVINPTGWNHVSEYGITLKV